MNKKMGLFWLFFIILLILNYYVYRFIVKYIYQFIGQTWLDFTNIMVILIFLIIVIPLTAYLSEKLAKLSFT
ncbi:hypothetical protein QA612_13645 [Evansella sp. AB-P1]|uniref:hypothetical protein n=1 Tax=Evansella sp. AB-P1 TaxID=3037653 RepID=UPI00241F8CC2|nr:hypothetical protein [Evansella sp. AB-P1]MDG5788525.1 hypothetical protein [Evansella sp. AB-P1]